MLLCIICLSFYFLQLSISPNFITKSQTKKLESQIKIICLSYIGIGVSEFALVTETIWQMLLKYHWHNSAKFRDL